jgi:hypothetical protein
VQVLTPLGVLTTLQRSSTLTLEVAKAFIQDYVRRQQAKAAYNATKIAHLQQETSSLADRVAAKRTQPLVRTHTCSPCALFVPCHRLCTLSWFTHASTFRTFTPHAPSRVMPGAYACASCMMRGGGAQVVDAQTVAGGRVGPSAVFFFCGHAYDEDTCARRPDTGDFVCSLCQTEPEKQHIRRTAPAEEVRASACPCQAWPCVRQSLPCIPAFAPEPTMHACVCDRAHHARPCLRQSPPPCTFVSCTHACASPGVPSSHSPTPATRCWLCALSVPGANTLSAHACVPLCRSVCSMHACVRAHLRHACTCAAPACMCVRMRSCLSGAGVQVDRSKINEQFFSEIRNPSASIFDVVGRYLDNYGFLI